MKPKDIGNEKFAIRSLKFKYSRIFSTLSLPFLLYPYISVFSVYKSFNVSSSFDSKSTFSICAVS